MAAKQSSVLWVLLLANICLLPWASTSTSTTSTNTTQESSILKSDKSHRPQIPAPALENQLKWQETNRLLSVLNARPRNSTEPRAQQKRQVFNEPTSRREDPWFLDSGNNNAPQPYRFVYNVKGRNGQTEQYRREVGDGKFLTGSYGYMLPDGIYRHVDYVADERGFRAFIRTSEPGTANQNPADVVINSDPVPGLQPVSYDSIPLHLRAPFNYTYSPLLDNYSTLNNPSQQESNRLPHLNPGSIVGGYLSRNLSIPHTPNPNDKYSNPNINYIGGGGGGGSATDDNLSRVDYELQDSRWNRRPTLLSDRFKVLEPSSLSDWTLRQARFGARPPTNTYKLSYDRSPYEIDEPKSAPIKISYDHQQQTNLAPREAPQTVIDSAIPTLQPISSLGYSSQSFHAEQHKQSNGSRFISKVGEPNQFSFREQGSSSKTGSGRELEYINTSEKDNNSNSEQILLAPPSPQFNQLDELPQQQQHPTKDGRNILQAPYSSFRQETNGAHTGAEELKERGAVKGGSTLRERGYSGNSWPPQISAVRLVRMPEELRASLVMKDLRSMRNNLGLPQPPRMMANVGEQLDLHFNRVDLAHKAHGQRIDALLSHGRESAPSSSSDAPYSVHQQATVQSASAVNPPLPPPPSPPQQKTEDAYSVSTGVVQEFKPLPKVRPEPEFSQLAASNETFDARRLSGGPAKAQFLTERVSELEKFQQRLRAQQLLLENVKQQSNDRVRNINRLPVLLASKQRSSGLVVNSQSATGNSQVSYDEEPERSGEQSASLPKSVGSKWIEVGSKSNQVAASKPPQQQATQQRALSDFARDAKTWPSVVSNVNFKESKLQKNSSSSISDNASTSQLPNQLHRSINQQRVFTSPSTSNEAQKNLTQSSLSGTGNTINLDFINSVTALSVDDMNPFAIASVNPGVSGANNKQSAEGRLFPHRLLTASGDSTRPATINTRFFISPELKSAADYHEKQNTMGQLRSLFGVSSDENEIEPQATARGSSNGRPNNHKFSALPANGASAPYMLGLVSSASTKTSAEDAIGTSRLVLNPAASNGMTHGNIKKPMIEVSDASSEMSKHRFYEVASISSERQPSESVSAFLAFKG